LACRLSHALGLMVVLGMLWILGWNPAGRQGQGTAAAAPARPNVLLIVADDMRVDGLQAMPTIQKLAAQGVTFSRAMVTTPLCCPSRASILTGQLAHHHGVLTNEAPLGGVGAFDPTSTIATWLQGAGVRTGLIGRYLNQYDSLTIPPGWEHWFAFQQNDEQMGIYNDYHVNDNGVRRYFGADEDDYSTRVLGREARAFLAEQRERPFFLLLTPRAPHSPARPDQEDAGRYKSADLPVAGSYDEADVSDKPAWVRENGRLKQREIEEIEGLRRRQLEALVGLDREIGEIVDVLQADGRLATTWIIFTSDNGIVLGEHRLDVGKSCPYEACVNVPMVVVPPGGLQVGRTDDRLVANIDLAPTIAAIMGTTADASVDGMSWLPLLDGPDAAWRDEIVLEQWRDEPEKRWSGIRTPTHKFVRYDNGDEELYDLVTDPDELQNLARNSTFAAQRADLTTRLDALLAR
jgi:arylsulfatase A-like enzyme